MAHTSQANAATTSGEIFTTVDLSIATYPSTGKLCATCLYVSANATTSPTPVTAANPLYVTMSSLVPGTGATNLGKAIDSVAGATDTGIAPLAVRDDVLSTLTPIDGDYAPLRVDSTGALWVAISGSITVAAHAVTNAGTFVVQVDGTALTRLTDIETNTDSGAVVGNGAAATAQRVTLASDSTGIVALTTSTASIGKLAANSGVDIGDVDITSVVPGTGATNLGKAIDTATGATDTGVLLLATRDDALSSLTPAEGDNVQCRVDANGALWVIVSGTVTVGSHAVTNAGTFAVQAVCTNAGTFAVQAACTNAGTFVTQENGALLTAAQLIDDIVYTDDTSTHATGTSKGALIMAAAAPTDAAVNANDIGAVGMTVGRSLYVSVQDALPAGTNGIGKLTANAGVTIGAVEIAAAQTLATVTTVGTVTTCSTVTTLTGSSIAHDAADSGNPHKIGMKAIAHGTNPTAVAAADRSDLYCNRAGVPFVIGGHPNVITRTARVTDANGAQTDAAISAAIGSGSKAVVTRITVTADNDNSDDIRVKLGFGAATLPADATGGTNGILVDHPGVPAGGGFTIGDGSGILGIGADDEEVRLTCDDPAGGFVTISLSYYTIES